MTEAKLTEIGNAYIDLVGLKLKPNGRVDTSWGDKTPQGLALTVMRITDETREMS